MRLKLLFLSTTVLVLLLAPFITQAHGDQDECDLVYLFSAWARSTPAGAPTGAVFGVLVNLSGEQDTLLAASTYVAEVVEFHETVIGDGDVMQMRPVEGGFAVEPNNYLQLQPGGFHIMLINLRQQLEPGSTFDLLLEFEHAGQVTVTVPVRDMTDDMSADAAMMTETPSPLASAPATNWGEACAKMHVVGAWARPAVSAMPNSAAYALLLNLTATDDTLISATTEVAAAVELHEMRMGDNDVMQMRPLEDGIVVPSGSTAFLQPGGLHVMLIGLNQELAEGAALDLTLTFAESGIIELTVPIHQPMTAEMSMGSM